MIKDDQSFHQMHIFIKMSKHLLIILRMANSNHPQMEKIRIMVLMVDDHIRMSMPEINDEDVSNTDDVIPYQYRNQLGGKILAVWEGYKPLLEHDYSRSGYMLSLDAKTYAHAKLSVLYIYVNYHVIFLIFIILKRI